MPCIAEQACWYSQHSTPMELAAGGGADVAIHKRPQKLSPVEGGGYTISPGQRSRTYSADGKRLTGNEARAWRRQRAREKEQQQMVEAVEEQGKAEHVSDGPAAIRLTAWERRLANRTSRQNTTKVARAPKVATERPPVASGPGAKKETATEQVLAAPKSSSATGYDAFLAIKAQQEAERAAITSEQSEHVHTAPDPDGSETVPGDPAEQEPSLSKEANQILDFFKDRSTNARNADSLRYLAAGESLSKARLADLQATMGREGVYLGNDDADAAQPPVKGPKGQWRKDAPTTAQINYLAKLMGCSQKEAQHRFGGKTKGEVSAEISKVKAILYGDS